MNFADFLSLSRLIVPVSSATTFAFNPLTHRMTKADTIIYVDDDLDDIELLTDVFTLTAHHLKTFSKSSELLPYLDGHFESTCLVVLDINLPGQNGFELMQEIRASKTFPHLPVVLFSTGADSPQAGDAKAVGVDIIKKPSSMAEWERVAELLNELCLHGQGVRFTR